jgi:hypothetical protein
MSRLPFRRIPPPTPEQILSSPVSSYQPTWHTQPWSRAMAHNTLGPSHIAIGVVQSHLTHHFHAVLSLYGTDLTTLGVFTTLPPAQQTAEDFGKLFVGWNDRPEAESQARHAVLLAAAEAASISPPNTWLLPDAQVSAFLAEVARYVQRAN